MMLAEAKGFAFQIQGQPMCLPGPLEMQPRGYTGLSQALAAPGTLGCEQLPLIDLNLSFWG